jgi:hypothetical protein
MEDEEEEWKTGRKQARREENKVRMKIARNKKRRQDRSQMGYNKADKTVHFFFI